MRRFLTAGLVLCTVMACLFAATSAFAQDTTNLINPDSAMNDWSFSLGQEFPGAKGQMTLEPEASPSRGPALKLHGDFSGGGNYVAAARDLPAVNPRMLSFNLKYPGASQISLRLTDTGGTTHQIVFSIDPRDGWQRVQFPVDAFFKNLGTPQAVQGIDKYEKWGPNKGQGWQPPARQLAVILSRRHVPEDTKVGNLWLADLQLSGAPAVEGGADENLITRIVRLDDVLRAGQVDWRFWRLGKAAGKLSVITHMPADGERALKLEGDFSEDKTTVAMTKEMGDLAVKSVEAIHLKMMSPNINWHNMRLTDATGQVHQRKYVKFQGDGQWYAITIDPEKVAGGEHWGGANDGKLHQPVKSFSLMIRPDDKTGQIKPELYVSDIRAEVTMVGQTSKPSYTESFEDADPFKDWQTTADARRVTGQAMHGEAALRLERTVDERANDIQAIGPSFPVGPGTWIFTGGTRADIHSPDSSYHGRLEVQWLNGDNVIGSRVIHETYNQPTWRAFKTELEAPTGATAARLRVSMQKTYGWYAVDNLSAARAAAPPVPQRITRISLTSDVEGNLFLPGQDRRFDLVVMSRKPLEPANRKVTLRVSDYWGAEYATKTVDLEEQGYKDNAFRYGTTVDFSDVDLEPGKFFLINVTADPQGEKYTDYRGMAVLPEAPSHVYAHEDIPFSMRNWDPRVAGWVPLAARLGLRKVATWSDYKDDKPETIIPARYKEILAHDMKVTTSPRKINAIERGSDWNPEDLRTASRTLAELVGDNAAYMPLGNEPHGGMEEIKRNAEAYKVAYEAIKEVNPDQFVLATSILDERYFQAGYHHYCDGYDFHIYESYRDMPGRIQRLEDWGEKYGAPKPVFCTEMGLNSQGMTRHAVAVDMIKKFTMFFAHGGAHCSWFTIHYPDPSGKLRGGSGEAHNMFDAIYREYNPKLDAITHYHFLNTLLDKDEVAREVDDDQTEAFLFANEQGQCLQVLWNDAAETATFVALPGVDEVRVVRIDGSDVTMQTADGGITLGVGEEPLLLTYEQARPRLAPTAEPRIRLSSSIQPLVRGEQQAIELAGEGLTTDNVALQAPPRWRVELEAAGEGVVRAMVQAPGQTQARQGRLLAQRVDTQGNVVGELPLAVPLTGRIMAGLRPTIDEAGDPVVQLTIANNGAESVTLNWALSLDEQFPMIDGQFQLKDGAEPGAFFSEAAFGDVTLAAGKDQVIRLPIRDIDPIALYRVTATLTDPAGATIVSSRYMGGFQPVYRANTTMRIDGKLDEAAWEDAPTFDLDKARQYYVFSRVNETWEGPEDLSGKARVLWDDKQFYLAVEVTDDAHHGGKPVGGVWNQDGLQMFIDPSRTADQKPGKYDYYCGIGADGPGVACSYSASGSIVTGPQPDVAFDARSTGDAGSVVYEMAFPWRQFAPFKPEPHANLGFTLIINEDDGKGRGAFIGWFSGAHSKQLDMVGDMILIDRPASK